MEGWPLASTGVGSRSPVEARGQIGIGELLLSLAAFGGQRID